MTHGLDKSMEGLFEYYSKGQYVDISAWITELQV